MVQEVYTPFGFYLLPFSLLLFQESHIILQAATQSAEEEGPQFQRSPEGISPR